MKKTCPYWYQLRRLIGSCTSFCDHAITNSQEDMSIIMTRGQPLEIEDIFDNNNDLELEMEQLVCFFDRYLFIIIYNK